MKYLLWIGIATLVIGGLVVAVSLNPVSSPQAEQTAIDQPSAATDEDEAPQAEQEQTLAAGRYELYESNKVSQSGYSETILFFYAAWCPECRAFDMAITETGLPDGTQVLQVDYDNSDALRAQHEVTLQSTFVKVDGDGNQLTKWVGYGRDKSVSAILENT